MNAMSHSREASGLAIAFLVFAITLLAVPLSDFLIGTHGPSPEREQLIRRALPFLLGALILALFPELRKRVGAMLAKRLPAGKRIEVGLVTIAKFPLFMAGTGALALWYWASGGPLLVEQHMTTDVERQYRLAFSPEGLLLFLLLGAIVAPLVEEIVFRGFLFKAWERRWGWFPSMVLVSILFGLYHPHFASAFVSSVVLVCVYRRTGSIRAPIIVHSMNNLMLWYPLGGQWLIPRHEALGDLASWWLHLAFLVLGAIGVCAYIWLTAQSESDPLESR